MQNLPTLSTHGCLWAGDFVDRGSFSVEVILALLAFKCLYPDHMHLARGNHESQGMNKIYGFEGEVRAGAPPLLPMCLHFHQCDCNPALHSFVCPAALKLAPEHASKSHVAHLLMGMCASLRPAALVVLRNRAFDAGMHPTHCRAAANRGRRFGVERLQQAPCEMASHAPSEAKRPVSCAHGAQVKAKYSMTMASLFRETFCWLPLAHLLNSKVLVVHGGLFSKDGVTLDDLRAIDRYRCGLQIAETPLSGIGIRLSSSPGFTMQQPVRTVSLPAPVLHACARQEGS